MNDRAAAAGTVNNNRLDPSKVDDEADRPVDDEADRPAGDKSPAYANVLMPKNPAPSEQIADVNSSD
jgi:hypothetical protein